VRKPSLFKRRGGRTRNESNLLALIHKTLFALRHAWRSRRWRPAEQRVRPAGGIVVSGFFDEALGIGRAGRLTADALEAAGHAVAREDLRSFDRGLLTRPSSAFPIGRAAATWLIHANPPEARIALFTHDERVWRNMYRIGYWVWESDLAPESWAAMAQWFDEIWTPSQFSADALRAAFITHGRPEDADRLRVLPHPVALAAPASGGGDTVTALALFDPRSGFDRKNPAGAIIAWQTAFPAPAEGMRLIVKSLADAPRHPDYDALLALAGGRPDIVFRAETLDDAAQDALLDGCDILLSLHRAEGFGLPLAEAMARGLVVVATGATGNMQFMTAENSVPVASRPVSASSRYNGPAAKWAEPDITAAAQALRELAANPNLRRSLGDQARKDIATLSDAWRRPEPPSNS
jgi:glycosyltransferase involved in cell wall biosynthesis